MSAKSCHPSGIRLNRVILYVTNMQTQVEFFRDTLGFPLIYPEDIDDLSG